MVKSNDNQSPKCIQGGRDSVQSNISTVSQQTSPKRSMGENSEASECKQVVIYLFIRLKTIFYF